MRGLPVVLSITLSCFQTCTLWKSSLMPSTSTNATSNVAHCGSLIRGKSEWDTMTAHVNSHTRAYVRCAYVRVCTLCSPAFSTLQSFAFFFLLPTRSSCCLCGDVRVEENTLRKTTERSTFVSLRFVSWQTLQHFYCDPSKQTVRHSFCTFWNRIFFHKSRGLRNRKLIGLRTAASAKKRTNK